MEELLKHIIEYLKGKKILYSVNEDLITLHTGTYECVLQVEVDGDYIGIQAWITSDGMFDDSIYHESSTLNPDLEEFEEMIDQVLAKSREISEGIAKLSKLIKQINIVLEDYNISSKKFISLFEEENEYNL